MHAHSINHHFPSTRYPFQPGIRLPLRQPILPILPLLLPLLVFLLSCGRDVPPPEPVGPLPTERQLAWHEMEMNAFIHFTTNTFTDLEWGFGDESPDVFNPTDFDPDQWIEVLKTAGFKGLVLTCKHHDGFCLWPSAYTEHTVANSPWMQGEGDVVGAVRDACRRHGLKFGVYLSPWDRNRADYGKPSYITYYRNQLKELFTAYGPVFEMWFDGANGGDGWYGGARETRRIDGETYYDWPGTLAMIREMEPEVIFFSDAGPDIRWCGNEQGVGGETNWNTISVDTLYAGKPNIHSLLNTGTPDGSSWVPAEVNTSIRPGWFWHASEDSLVKTPEELFDIYLTSVGRGSNLLLNVPPDRTGRLHPNDVNSLLEWRRLLDKRFATDLAAGAEVKAGNTRGGTRQKATSNRVSFSPLNLTDGDPDTYWAAEDGMLNATLEVAFDSVTDVRYLVLREYIRLGQRVKAFSVDAWVEGAREEDALDDGTREENALDDGAREENALVDGSPEEAALDDGTWQQVASGTTIGYKRILTLAPSPVAEAADREAGSAGIRTSRLRIRISDAKACPVLSTLEVY